MYIIYMISYIIDFLRINRKKEIFNKEYRDGYSKLWINNIRNYHP